MHPYIKLGKEMQEILIQTMRKALQQRGLSYQMMITYISLSKRRHTCAHLGLKSLMESLMEKPHRSQTCFCNTD